MASFVGRDYDLLKTAYRMRRRFYRGSLHGLPDRVSIYLGVRRSDFNVSWFAYDQAHYAVSYSRRLGKKSLVILGGFDVCEEEDSNLLARLPSLRYILDNADRLLAVSKRVKDKAESIARHARVDLVYHGFDAGRFRPSMDRRESLVTTIAHVKKSNLERKGLFDFVRTAALLPEYSFALVGKWMDGSVFRLRQIATPNVTFVGELEEEQLVQILQRTTVYVQASTHEGFGCSLAEAMLCGCTPVVSDRGAIPEVVGDTGIYVEPHNPRSIGDAIRFAASQPGLGIRARERIIELFPLESRRKALLATVAEMLE